MMKLIIFVGFVAFAACEERCYEDVKGVCQPVNPTDSIKYCDAKYGDSNENDNKLLNDYLNVHIGRSMQYLMMSSHFGVYKTERNGLKKLYRKLSDSTWEDALDMVKYMTRRGLEVDVKPRCRKDEALDKAFCQNETFTLQEFESLAKAVDIQKKLAEEAHTIYKDVNIKDPEMGGYLVDHFMPKHAKSVRELVGYTTDLKRLLQHTQEKDIGLQLFLLDEYLNKNL